MGRTAPGRLTNEGTQASEYPTTHSPQSEQSEWPRSQRGERGRVHHQRVLIAASSGHPRQALDLYLDKPQRRSSMEYANDKDTGHCVGFQGDLVQKSKGRLGCTDRERILACP